MAPGLSGSKSLDAGVDAVSAGSNGGMGGTGALSSSEARAGWAGLGIAFELRHVGL